MTVTEVRIYGQARGRCIALAAIVLDDCFAIRDIRIVRSYEATRPLRVMMPSRAREDGTQAEYCHPIRRAIREMIEAAILGRLSEVQPNAATAAQAAPER